LPRLEEWNEHRRKVAGWYRERLAGLPLGFQARTEGETHIYHLFQVRTAERDSLLAHLRARDIDVVVRYPTPIHLQPAFAAKGWKAGRARLERLVEPPARRGRRRRGRRREPDPFRRPCGQGARRGPRLPVPASGG